MRGGTPASLATRWSTPYQATKKKPLLVRAINRIGRTLASI